SCGVFSVQSPVCSARFQAPGGYSLCLDLTVKSQSGPGHPWYEVQASVDKKPVFQYDSDSSKMKPLGLLGAKVNATKAWTELTQTLGEVGRELRMIVSDIKLENSPPTLHIQLSCQCEAERGTAASWHFNINGQPALLFDAMSMTWTVTSPGAREEWKNKGLADYFRRISMGDCRHWLREFLEHWEKVLEPPASQENWVSVSQAGLWLWGRMQSGKDLGQVTHGSRPSPCPLIRLYTEMMHFLSVEHTPPTLGQGSP
uniref:MHC class I-like antigen recognition-like domain-containing protein n=1 Tax=Lynx canadensis TaxID=61383 RepID=A0A667G5A5_LYNCA